MSLATSRTGPEVGDVVEYLKDKQDEYAAQGRELTKDEAKRLLLEDYQ